MVEAGRGRVLVTGGAGFIGSHLVEGLLGAGYSVTVIDNESTGDRSNVPAEARFVSGDVRSPDDLMTAFDPIPDAVFHVAGQASIQLAYSNPGADLGVNVTGTLEVLQQCLAHEVPRLVYASSMTVYGNPALVPTPESSPPDPVSFYGVTKYAAERYVHLTGARTDLETKITATSLRMFNVFGPRQSLSNPYQGVLAIFLGRLLRGESISIHGDGEQTRDFVYVDDVVRAWLNSLENPAANGRVFNVGSGAPTSVNRLCDVILAQFGKTRQTHRITSAPSQQGDVRASAADISLIREAIGWSPRVSFADGLEKTVAWARAHLSQGRQP